MSSFKDNFGKNDESKETLDYDDSAFYFFASTILIIVIIIYSIFFFKSVFRGKKVIEANQKVCR